MKSTGVVRRIDELGRVVLPIEIRKLFDIANKDAIEIFVDDDKIILKKYEPSCIFCGSMNEGAVFHGKIVCNKCLSKLKLGECEKEDM